jgi:hypothetical protein
MWLARLEIANMKLATRSSVIAGIQGIAKAC